jgi:hypothetical protein
MHPFRSIILYAALGLLFHTTLNHAHASKHDYIISTGEELQRLFEHPVDSVTVLLRPGEYFLTPIEIIDSTCGNCEDPDVHTETTAGLILTGRWIKISGPEDRSAVIHTNAGYGLFIYRTARAEIENLVITGGMRTPDGNATDAAIVVKESEAYIHGNIIRDNIGDSGIVSDIIVGIAGIAGRENSKLSIRDNDIIRNSWDGIALYRFSVASIMGNYIDGVDKATGQVIGGGRGVGIGVTWNARAIIRDNLVTRYWKGIGVFVDAEGEIENNLVEDIVTWGIALWSAGDGSAGALVGGNVIYRTGACGVSVSLSSVSSGGSLSENIIVESGQNPRYDDPEYYCAQIALAVRSAPEIFVIKDNIYFNNRRMPEDLPDFDLSEEAFNERLRSICGNLRSHQFSGKSFFVKTFCIERSVK